MSITFDLELSYTRPDSDYATYDIKKSEFKENEYYVLTCNGLYLVQVHLNTNNQHSYSLSEDLSSNYFKGYVISGVEHINNHTIAVAFAWKNYIKVIDRLNRKEIRTVKLPQFNTYIMSTCAVMIDNKKYMLIKDWKCIYLYDLK